MASGDILRNLPPRMQMYPVINSHYPVLWATLLAEAKRLGIDEDKVSQYGFNLERQKAAIELQTVGSDAAVLTEIHYDAKDENFPSSDIGSDNHDVMAIGLELYNDGSPYVPDGDLLHQVPEGGWSLNSYKVYFSPELPPTMVQAEQCYFFSDVERWHKAGKHLLSDGDCQRLTDLVLVQQVDFEGSLYPDAEFST